MALLPTGGTMKDLCPRSGPARIRGRLLTNRVARANFRIRVSSETMQANQMRMYLSAMAYVLVCGLRRLGLKNTELAQAQVSTIRTRLLKIGARVRVSVRRIYLSMAASYPWASLFAQVHAQLRAVAAPTG